MFKHTRTQGNILKTHLGNVSRPTGIEELTPLSPPHPITVNVVMEDLATGSWILSGQVRDAQGGGGGGGGERERVG